MEKLENEDEIMERIKNECKCGYCHGSIYDGAGLGCTCSLECKIVARLKEEEKRALSSIGPFYVAGVPYGAVKWFSCANLATQLGLHNKVVEYRKKGILAYEKNGDFIGAKKYAENFGLTDLAEYYQRLISLKASRPE